MNQVTDIDIRWPDVLVIEDRDFTLFVPFNDWAADILRDLDLFGTLVYGVLVVADEKESDTCWALWDLSVSMCYECETA